MDDDTSAACAVNTGAELKVTYGSQCSRGDLQTIGDRDVGSDDGIVFQTSASHQGIHFSDHAGLYVQGSIL